jgi:hypothetical protein
MPVSRHTSTGIKRVPCVKRGAPSYANWNICADKIGDRARYRGLCKEHDVELNEIVMRWVWGNDRDAKSPLIGRRSVVNSAATPNRPRHVTAHAPTAQQVECATERRDDAYPSEKVMSEEGNALVEAASPPIESAPEPAEETVNLQAEAEAQRAPNPPEEEVLAETPEAEEFEEFDWNGKRIRAPKGLKEGVMKNADYTQKTQAVAERQRELEAYEQQIAQQAQATDAELDARASLKNLDVRIKPYADLTEQQWIQWEAEDPLAAQQGWRTYQMLHQDQNKAKEQLTTLQTQRAEAAKSADSIRFQETDKFARSIPGWTPEVGPKIAEYAASRGIDRQTLEANINPALYGILYDAMIGQKALQKPPTAPLPPSNLKPLTVVGSKTNAPVRKSITDPNLSMEEYASMRKEQIERKARR